MAGEIFAGLSALKTAFDIAKGLKDIDDAVRRNAAVIDLQSKILTAQEEHSTLIDHVRELKEQIARFEAWEAEKKRYELKQVPPGVFVYALKPAMADGEPPHLICEKCYQNGKKSILHSDGGYGGTELRCRGCGAKFFVHSGQASYPSV
jgi:hypothetical protein